MKTVTVQSVAFQMDDELYKWYTRPNNLEVGPGSIWHWHPQIQKEMEAFQLLCKHMKYPVFLDVGAHIGIFSFVYCSLTPNHKCYSIEPVRGHINRIESVAQTNGFNINAYHLGFGDRSRTAHYDNLHMARWVEELNVVADETADDVRMTTLDDFVRLTETPSLIKIDTEGFEVPILRGSQETLRSATPTLFVEVHVEESKNLGHNLEDICELIPSELYTFKECNGQIISFLREFIFRGPNQRFIAHRKN